jgi:hypothetical protein
MFQTAFVKIFKAELCNLAGLDGDGESNIKLGLDVIIQANGRGTRACRRQATSVNLRRGAYDPDFVQPFSTSKSFPLSVG